MIDQIKEDDSKKVTVEEYLAILRSQLGVKFKHQGRLWNYGIDCVGLLVGAAKECGINYNDNTQYDLIVNKDMFLALMNSQLDQIELNQARVGDVLVFFVLGNPQHVAFITDIIKQNNKTTYQVIHAYMPSRKVIEHLLPKELEDNIAYCFRSRFLKD